MVRSFTRILQAIVMLCCFSSLVSSRTREEYSSRLRNRGFTCSHTANASVSFLNNLNPLLSDFNEQSLIARYYNISLGDGLDRVYGYYMCRGDVSLQICNSCIINGTQFASEANCEHLDGFFHSELCIFMFSNRSMYGLWEDTSYVFDFIEVNVSNYHQFNQTLSTTMEELINNAAYESTNNGFATMEAEVTGADETIYSLAQCTPDIVGLNCSRCLKSGLSTLRRWADGAPAAYATMNKCHLRYDNVSFYNLVGESNVGAKMKKSRDKVIGEQRVVPDYEKQRLHHLIQNAEIMEAKGHGSLATKILQQKAKLFSKSARCEDVNSNEEADYEKEDEGEGSEGEMRDGLRRPPGHKEANMKPPVKHQSAKSAAFVTQPSNKQSIQKGLRSRTMAEYVKQRALQQSMQNSVHSESHAKEKHHVEEVQSQVHKRQKGQEGEQPCLKSQKKQQSKRICLPGSLSKYYEMRKKQVRNIRGEVVFENGGHSENDLEFGSELQSSSIERGGEDDQETGENTETIALERVSVPTIEPLKEVTKKKKHRGPTRLTSVHARTKEERPIIILNSYGQPIGPTQKIVDEYTRFLGTLARDSNLAPITVCISTSLLKLHLLRIS